MSDSELSDAPLTPIPTDSDLERSLRQEVVKAQRAGGDEHTVNSIRAASEAQLGLKPGFYKGHETWLSKSKTIIKAQFAIDAHSLPSPAKTKAAPPVNRPKKRASEEREPWPRKRKKTAAEPKDHSTSDDLSSPPSDTGSDSFEEPPKNKRQAKTKKPAPKAKAKGRVARPREASSPPISSDGRTELSEGSDAEPKSKKRGQKAVQSGSKKHTKAVSAKKAGAESSKVEEKHSLSHETSTVVAQRSHPEVQQGDDSDSELSVLLDEEPPTKKRQKTKEPAGHKPKKSNPTKGKSEADADPDQAEIKRLQGWLVKCGIRKVWGKELKPYETPRAKIKHLKDMLTDAGMTGRYSVEKANQIKEARELAADIEAVQEGAERWGADDGDEDRAAEDGGRPARRLVRGSKNYDFLSSDGEETD